MKKEQYEALEKWFRDYIAGFYCGDDFVDANLRLKEEHTFRVCAESRYICEGLGFGESERLLAEAIGLFHDVGRFLQFSEYRTYCDYKSVNHCGLGLEVLWEHGVLERLEQREREIIETAISLHGSKELPASLDGDAGLFSKLIRDADKLDIYKIVIKNYKDYESSPEGFVFEVEFPDSDGYTRQIVETICRGDRIDYHKVRTMNDLRLLQLGWVFDVNFLATLARIKERGYLEELFAMQPAGGETERIKDYVMSYVEKRLG